MQGLVLKTKKIEVVYLIPLVTRYLIPLRSVKWHTWYWHCSRQVCQCL